MDETYIKVKGPWVYLYPAVDKFGKTLEFVLSKRRNKPPAIKFLARAMAPVAPDSEVSAAIAEMKCPENSRRTWPSWALWKPVG